jgi:hypothetical protein
MLTFIPERVRVPVYVGVAGILLAIAFFVRGGRLWWVGILALVAAVAQVYGAYRRGGEDSDEGAIAGSRADERQQLIGTRSYAVAGRAAMIASYLGLVAGIADDAIWWWPFAVMLGITGLAYLFGLSNYGTSTAAD